MVSLKSLLGARFRRTDEYQNSATATAHSNIAGGIHHPSHLVQDSAASTASSASCSSTDGKPQTAAAASSKLQKHRRGKSSVAFVEGAEHTLNSMPGPDKAQSTEAQLNKLFSRLGNGGKKKGLGKSKAAITSTSAHSEHYIRSSSTDTWFGEESTRWSMDASRANTPALTPSATYQEFTVSSGSSYASSSRQITPLQAVMMADEAATPLSPMTPVSVSSGRGQPSTGWLSIANTVCRDTSIAVTSHIEGEDTETEDADELATTQPRRLASCPEAAVPRKSEEAKRDSKLDAAKSRPNLSVMDNATTESFINTANTSVFTVYDPAQSTSTGEYALGHAADAARRRSKPHRPVSTAVNALLRKVFRPHKSSTHGNSHNGRYDPLETYYKPAGVVLGSGTGGSVRLYHRKSDNQRVAVKFFRRDTEQVRRELTLAQTLPAHPHLMQTLGVYRMNKSTRAHALSLPSTEMGRAEASAIEASKAGYRAADVPVLVTDYYPDDLFAVIERSEDMTIKERDRLFAQLVYAVAHLHRHGLAHRDLKLENACVDPSGSLRLIDLGSSASARERNGNVIKSHQIHGSDPYVAPEVLTAAASYELARERNQGASDDHGYDPFAADSWSLGVIYLCLVRRCFHWEKADVDEDAGYRYFINRRERFLGTFTERERAVIEALLSLDPQKRCSPGDLLVRMPWLRAHLTPATEMDARLASIVKVYTARCTTNGSMLTIEQVNELKSMFRDAQGNLDLDRFLCRPVHGGGANGDASQMPVTIDSCVW